MSTPSKAVSNSTHPNRRELLGGLLILTVLAGVAISRGGLPQRSLANESPVSQASAGTGSSPTSSAPTRDETRDEDERRAVHPARK